MPSAGRPRIYGDVTLTCRQCQLPFSMRGGEARGYEKRHGKPKPYCSMKCFYEGASRHEVDPNEEAPTYVCSGCGEIFPRRRDRTVTGRSRGWDFEQKYHSVECHQQARTARHQDARDAGYMPKGHIQKDGYHVIKVANGKNVKAHRFIMERILGRPLRDNENVHHLNGNKSDNRPENLELWVKTQPCGQRVTDQVQAALALIESYPEFLVKLGRRIVSTEEVGDYVSEKSPDS